MSGLNANFCFRRTVSDTRSFRWSRYCTRMIWYRKQASYPNSKATPPWRRRELSSSRRNTNFSDERSYDSKDLKPHSEEFRHASHASLSRAQRDVVVVSHSRVNAPRVGQLPDRKYLSQRPRYQKEEKVFASSDSSDVRLHDQALRAKSAAWLSSLLDIMEQIESKKKHDTENRAITIIPCINLIRYIEALVEGSCLRVNDWREVVGDLNLKIRELLLLDRQVVRGEKLLKENSQA